MGLNCGDVPTVHLIGPRDRQTQLFQHDQDGIAVELNDPPSETTG